jgi:hypothetical protein
MFNFSESVIEEMAIVELDSLGYINILGADLAL